MSANIDVICDGREKTGRQRYRHYIMYQVEGEEGVNEISLPIEAFVKKKWWLDPDELDFGLVKLGKSATRKIEIEGFGMKAWKPKLGSHAEEYEIIDFESRGSSCTIQIVANPKRHSGSRQDRVRIVTGDDPKEFVEVPVNVEVPSDFALEPSSLNLEEIDLANISVREVAIDCATGTWSLSVLETPYWLRAQTRELERFFVWSPSGNRFSQNKLFME